MSECDRAVPVFLYRVPRFHTAGGAGAAEPRPGKPRESAAATVRTLSGASGGKAEGTRTPWPEVHRKLSETCPSGTGAVPSTEGSKRLPDRQEGAGSAALSWMRENATARQSLTSAGQADERTLLGTPSSGKAFNSSDRIISIPVSPDVLLYMKMLQSPL